MKARLMILTGTANIKLMPGKRGTHTPPPLVRESVGRIIDNYTRKYTQLSFKQITYPRDLFEDKTALAGTSCDYTRGNCIIQEKYYGL